MPPGNPHNARLGGESQSATLLSRRYSEHYVRIEDGYFPDITAYKLREGDTYIRGKEEINLCHPPIYITTDSAEKAGVLGESRSATLLGRSCLEHYVHIKQ